MVVSGSFMNLGYMVPFGFIYLRMPTHTIRAMSDQILSYGGLKNHANGSALKYAQPFF